MMKLNLDFDDPQKLKRYLLVAGILIIIATFIWILLVGGNQEDKTDEKQVEVLEQYQSVPYSKDLFVDYNQETNEILVTYPGYKTVDEVEVQIIKWYKENTDLKKISISYGEIGAEKRSYDLTKDLSEILKDNSFMNAPDSEPVSF